MSATTTSVDFLALARDYRDYLVRERETHDQALAVLAEIADAAKSDNNGGLPRLGFAIAAEARSLVDLMDDHEPGFQETDV